ncbi:MAG TPA: hypothetical protein VK453_08740 [Micromonosporaceae bacterium]|nr:hypothetical protein [Micromonosporaceae bacterium]
MRGVLTAAVLVTVAILGTGCTGKSGTTATPAQSDVATAAQPSLEPKVKQACEDAAALVDQSITKMTAQVDKVLAAVDSGDAAAQQAEMTQIRATFTEWSTTLRGQATKVTDPKLRSVLTQYAGAVESAIAEIKSPDDLDKLYTFDDSALDQAANNLAQICN